MKWSEATFAPTRSLLLYLYAQPLTYVAKEIYTIVK